MYRLLVKSEIGWHPAVITNSGLQKHTYSTQELFQGAGGVFSPSEFSLPPEFGCLRMVHKLLVIR